MAKTGKHNQTFVSDRLSSSDSFRNIVYFLPDYLFCLTKFWNNTAFCKSMHGGKYTDELLHFLSFTLSAVSQRYDCENPRLPHCIQFNITHSFFHKITLSLKNWWDCQATNLNHTRRQYFSLLISQNWSHIFLLCEVFLSALKKIVCSLCDTNFPLRREVLNRNCWHIFPQYASPCAGSTSWHEREINIQKHTQTYAPKHIWTHVHHCGKHGFH